MNWRILISAVLLLCAATAQTPRIDFGRDVRPILAENCFHCHGQDSNNRMANLRLDVSPGPAALAKVVARITSDKPALKMPPTHSNRTLTPAQVETLRAWISAGAPYAKHWAFTPPVRPALPAGIHPVDHFVRARLKAEGLPPRTPAAPAAWLRRVSLDLTGLPPTPDEIDDFQKAAAKGERAYEAAVDRLLASPRFGERMAMDWLDVARYADTHGFNNDASREMWRWRDWVIDAFNNNKPYDRFLTEQLAGDLLPNPTLEQRIATGYGRNHVINSEGGIIEEEYRVEYVADRVRTLGMSWLGLTLECARCHDHKYDPISQRDHYRFYAFFNNVSEVGEDGRVFNAVPMIPAPTPAQQRELRDFETRIAKLAKAVQKTPAPHPGPAPAGATLAIDCDSPATGLRSVPGIAGSACELSPAAKPQAEVFPITKRGAFSFSAWLRPAEADKDVALLSAMEFNRNPAATTYGAGIELRIVNGELEFRFGQRFPSYAARVQSVGARLGPAAWRHIAMVYEGAPAGANRVHASWVRFFADGRELETKIINDGAPMPAAEGDKPSQTRFRIGWDNGPDSPRFRGQFDDLRGWPRALAPTEIRAALRLSSASLESLESLRADYLKRKRELPTAMVMEEMPTPRETHVLLRGAYNMPGEKVEPGVPEEILGAWPTGAPRNRLGLAQWLTKPDHPLTARVVVNRFWQHLFGHGLVRTSENFGVQGESPTHPELLDWLAREFIDSGWNVKRLYKLIVLSQTYRQDSSAPPSLISRDPENRLLSRGPRFRLPAEVIRDQALQVAGLLKHRIGGPSVFPAQPAGLYNGIVVAADYPGTSYIESTGDDRHRRSLYTFWKRTVPHPAMTVFDAPDREFCIVRRSVTNTPLQALTLLNDPIYVEAARKLAERMLREAATTEARLTLAHRLATGRVPDRTELDILGRSFSALLASYNGNELDAYSAVAAMILNLDETVTKG
jgi:hypothetical protein